MLSFTKILFSEQDVGFIIDYLRYPRVSKQKTELALGRNDTFENPQIIEMMGLRVLIYANRKVSRIILRSCWPYLCPKFTKKRPNEANNRPHILNCFQFRILEGLSISPKKRTDHTNVRRRRFTRFGLTRREVRFHVLCFFFDHGILHL